MTVRRLTQLFDGLLTLTLVLGDDGDGSPDLIRKGSTGVFNLLTEVPDLLF